MIPLLILDNIILFCLWMYWVAIYWVSEWVSKWKLLSPVRLFVNGLSPWSSPGQNTGVGSLSLLKGIFTTQGSNPGLPHFKWIFYQLSHKGSPRILKWVAYPFSSGSSWPRNRTGVSCIAGGFFINWAMREAIYYLSTNVNLSFITVDNCYLLPPPST